MGKFALFALYVKKLRIPQKFQIEAAKDCAMTRQLYGCCPLDSEKHSITPAKTQE
jgi:hypothetical protein